ncbi:MAG TPA: SDR family NAD(P)-dependent oxidoreductase [Thermoplasmata archaeon]|nr:SDR family NAD(P)-dependent oxidoreductase [Thermoplasmata archaeon]
MSGAAPTEPIVVTGSTGSIGGAAAKSLAAQGRSLILLARDPAKGADVREQILHASHGVEVEVVPCDLSSMSSVRTAAAAITSHHPKLGGLIHCAAVFAKERRETPDGFELMFATNHLGPFLVTRELLGPLRAGAPSRVLTVSAPSTTELDFEDLQSARKFGSLTAFGATKTANLLFAYALAHRMAGTGVTSNVFFPGLVRSKLMQEAPAIVRGLAGLAARKPEEAGSALAWLAVDPALGETTGRFFKLRKPDDSSAYSRDAGVQQRLWDVSERLLGVGSA